MHGSSDYFCRQESQQLQLYALKAVAGMFSCFLRDLKTWLAQLSCGVNSPPRVVTAAPLCACCHTGMLGVLWCCYPIVWALAEGSNIISVTAEVCPGLH